MRKSPPGDLVIISFLSVLLVVVVTFVPSSVLRLVLGMPFMLFFPGYVLTAALFPRRNDLEGLARLAVSFVMSLVVASLIGLILNYTPVGFQLYPVLFVIAGFIVVTSLVAWRRRAGVPDGERFTVGWNYDLSALGAFAAKNRAVLIVVTLMILAAVGTLTYTLAGARQASFTEFYILGTGPGGDTYPRNVVLGQSVNVTVVVVHHGADTASYALEVTIAGVRESRQGPLVLKPNDTWKQTVTFMPRKLGNDQKVEFTLYQDGKAAPGLSPLYLWVNVTQK